ncbi:MAG: VWA domain-containing protein [Vicinamibacterales bacterium]
MLDTLSSLLLGVRWVVLGQGEFRLAPPPGVLLAAGLAVVAIGATVITYRRAPRRLTTRDRVVLVGLRTALVALLLLCLFRPMLVLRAAVPHQNVVGVLLDDSRSMRIADRDGQPRSRYVLEQFGAADQGLRRALGERFTVRTMRFSSGVNAAPSGADLTFDGTNTRLAAALDEARQQLAGVPLAGLVVVSDGADTTGDAVEPALLALKAAGVPVFAIGVGRDTAERDIQVGRVTAPRTVLAGTTLLLDALVTAHGYAGQSLTVDVLDGSRLVGSQAFTVAPDGQPTTVRVRFTAEDPGPRVFTFRVAPQPGELLAENNVRDVLVDVRDEREKILYFEGEPRFEMKFLRRAVDEDKHLQLVVLQRTADNKYMRLEVDDPDELIGGFPKSRDELFKYRGVVLGSIEAAAFTGDQLAMLTEFVDRRGGGLLMLGGPRSFSEGGYAGTALGDALPVELTRMTPPAEPLVTRIAVRPTRAGNGHAVSQIAATEAASATRWTELPELTTVNTVDTVKAGATTLLSAADGRRERPVLAFQRFGRGKSGAFTPQDSWLWQMHASIPVEDQTHEIFVRQLMRWLVDGVPEPVELTTAADRVDPGQSIALTAEIADPSFVAVNDASVTATVTAPDGSTATVPLTWNGQRDGVYTGTAPTSVAGWYEATVEATRGETSLGRSTAHVNAGPGDAEFAEATRQMAALTRLADDTGGRAYTPETAEALVEDIKYTGRGITSVEERELWNAPIVLLLLLGLLSAEWGYRRAVGLS